MKKLALALVVAVALGVGTQEANAMSIGGIPGTTGVNDVLIGGGPGQFPALEGIYGANLYLVAGAATQITVEYLGWEASYNNYFFVNGVQLIHNQTTPLGLVGSPFFNPGLMTFEFHTPNGIVTNGSNVDPPGVPNFVLTLSPDKTTWDTTIDGSTYFFGQSVILALDDGGAGIDDNHDDLVVRMTITNGSFSVPDGGTTLALLGLGLAGIEVLRRRVRR